MDRQRDGLEQRLLILAPTGKDASLTQSILGRAGVACVACHDLKDVCQHLEAGGAAAVLLVEEMIKQDQNCLTEWLARQPPWSDLPVLVLARAGADSGAVAQAMDLLGNVTVLERPTRVAALVSAVRTALRGRQRQYQLREHVAALRESEQRFRVIADAAPMLVWMSGTDKLCHFFNKGWLAFTGRSLEQELGNGWTEGVHPDDLERCLRTYTTAFDAREVFEMEYRLRHCSGRYRWVFDRGIPRFDANGTFEGYIGSLIDVDERRQAEDSLRESEARFRMLADNMSQLAWTCDRLGNVTWYNRRWLEYTGLTFEEMQGWAWSKVQHPDHLDRVVARVKRSAETGEVWEDTFPLRGKDGSYRWFLSRAVPIRDEAGEIARWFGTNTDVTEQRALEEALRDADRRKDEFLATLAHELRNPLAPIRNSLHILRLTGRQDPGTERVGEMMERQVNHMVRLVDDLLEVSRITRGKIELRSELVEVETVVQNAVESSRPLIDAGGHRLNLALPPEALNLEGDPVRLTQVFANLLNNAAKYTDRGGQIWLTVRRDGDAVSISVRDTGTGIEPEMLPRVFEMFAQIDRNASRAQGGLGIGLTLVKRLVEMHGGSVEARSEGLGRGSEFVVRLPLAAGRSLADRPSTDIDLAAAPATLRVLVVDDNRDAAESLAVLLKLLGVEVQVVTSGRDALEAVPAYKPAVVLLDIGMPGMDGYEVARRIRAQPEFRDITLIALTGWGQDEDRHRTHSVGFDYHLVKPADIGALQTLLMSLEGTSESRRTSRCT